MGYRERLTKINKSDAEKYRNLTYKELDKKLKEENVIDEYSSFYGLPEAKELLILPINKPENFDYLEPFFNKFNIKEKSECDFYILSKDGLLKLIDLCNDYIVEMLEEQIEYLKKGEVDIPLFHLEMKKRRWSLTLPKAGKIRPYFLKDNKKKYNGLITNDEALEYQIFNLTFIYNTFDWERDYLIFNGW